MDKVTSEKIILPNHSDGGKLLDVA